MEAKPDNEELAALLARIADLLHAQGADRYRVAAYRAAAGTVRAWPEPVAEVHARGGASALEELPDIGRGIASVLSDYLAAGRVALLERLEGEVAPEELFTTVPGIGEELARRLHEALGIETLEELELAAHDGRLERVEGFGPRRVAAVRGALAEILSRSSRRRARRFAAAAPASPAPEARPPVALLLALDAEYRRRAAAGELRTIAPRRFNPSGETWLPILHCERDGWILTCLYSNTARAHELGHTRDWVVIYCERDGREQQCTVVTEHRGPLAGRRVVRGREQECAAHPAGQLPLFGPAAAQSSG